MNEWQPIETMPFGQQVLLLWHGGEPLAHYEMVMGIISPNNEWKRKEYWSPCGEYRPMDQIVAWTALPDPPKENV